MVGYIKSICFEAKVLNQVTRRKYRNYNRITMLRSPIRLLCNVSKHAYAFNMMHTLTSTLCDTASDVEEAGAKFASLAMLGDIILLTG